MAAPPMLRRREPRLGASSARADPVAALTLLLLGACALGLLVAAILAVYDYTTPTVEAPLGLMLALVFGAALLVNVAAAGLRHLARSLAHR